MSPVHVLQMSPVQVLQVQPSPAFTCRFYRDIGTRALKLFPNWTTFKKRSIFIAHWSNGANEIRSS